MKETFAEINFNPADSRRTIRTDVLSRLILKLGLAKTANRARHISFVLIVLTLCVGGYSLYTNLSASFTKTPGVDFEIPDDPFK